MLFALNIPVINSDRRHLPYYELGNMLRGYCGGYFENDEDAWDLLSVEFDRHFPSKNGREVELRKTLRIGITRGGNAK